MEKDKAVELFERLHSKFNTFLGMRGKVQNGYSYDDMEESFRAGYYLALQEMKRDLGMIKEG